MALVSGATWGVRYAPAAGVVGVAALACAQPLFDAALAAPALLPEVGAAELWIASFLLVLAPGLAAVAAVEVLARVLSRQADRRDDLRRRLHGLAVGVASAIAAFFFIAPIWPRGDGILGMASAVLAGLVAGVFVGRAWLRRAGFRRMLALVGWAVPLAPALFLFAPEIRPLWSGDDPTAVEAEAIESPLPVVVVVFDELPLATLLDPRGEIEDALFPNLTQLARIATWHRGAVTPAYDAEGAVRALLTGREAHEPADANEDGDAEGGDAALLSSRPRRELPVRGERRTLFGLLRESHEAVIGEPLLGYPHVPASAGALGRLGGWAGRSVRARFVPAADTAPGAEGPPSLEDFDAFLARIGDTADRPLFVYCHLAVPRRPWVHLASGTRYDPGSEGARPAALGDDGVWIDDEMAVLQTYRRHLLQAAYADRLLGRLFARLGASGLLHRSLLVVTATHGIHFDAGEPATTETEENRESLARIPLLVKRPGQTEGAVDEWARSLTDVLPTVIDVVDADVDWYLDGGTLLEPPPLRPGWPRIEPDRGIRGLWYASLAELGDPARPDPLHWGPLLRRLWRLEVPDGADPENEESSLESEWSVELDAPERFRRVGEGDPPLRVSGVLRRVTGGESEGDSPEPFLLALAVDGEVWATARGRPAPDGAEGERVFEALLPEGVLDTVGPAGTLDLQVLRVLGDGEALYLTPLPTTPPDGAADRPVP